MKKTFSRQYFNLKSCLRIESLTLAAFVVFLKFREYYYKRVSDRYSMTWFILEPVMIES